jgi:Domain of unknown function (DUF4333)
MPKRAWAGAALASALALLALAACGDKVIDDDKAEDAVQADLERGLEVEVESVECPSDVEVDPGETFECTVTAASGDRATATLKIRDEEANVRFVDLEPRK